MGASNFLNWLAFTLLGKDRDESLPDHSVLSKARVRFPLAVFAAIFTRIITLCRQRGLISGEIHFIDSSLVQADASRESFYRTVPQPDEYLRTLDDGKAQLPEEKMTTNYYLSSIAKAYSADRFQFVINAWIDSLILSHVASIS